MCFFQFNLYPFVCQEIQLFFNCFIITAYIQINTSFVVSIKHRKVGFSKPDTNLLATQINAVTIIAEKASRSRCMLNYRENPGGIIRLGYTTLASCIP
jgi:hypothetical protein